MPCPTSAAHFENPRMPLFLCLRFVRLPLQCLCRDESTAVAIVQDQRIVCSNDHAAALGVRPSQKLATARTLAGELRLLARACEREQALLEQLCGWAYGITPALRPWDDASLMLDVGGCLKLFHGLEGLLATVQRDLRWRGLDYCAALAPTPKAAWLLSHRDPAEGDITVVSNPAALPAALAPLPLYLLDEFAAPVRALAKAGIRDFSALLQLPAAALRQRCGNAFGHYLDQLLGRQADPLPLYPLPARFHDSYWLGYGVSVQTELLPAVSLLLHSLCRFLRSAQLQASTIEWQLEDLRGQHCSVTVHSSIAHDHQADWYQLTQIHLERLQSSQAVETLHLYCTALQPARQHSSDLFDDSARREPLHSLVDRLRSRLGQQALKRMACRDAHVPEQVSYQGAGAAASDTAPLAAQRPFWLLGQPEPLSARQGIPHWQGPLQLLAGPERIEDDWWREPVSRDYYVASSGTVGQCWIFWDRRSRCWYLHGIFI